MATGPETLIVKRIRKAILAEYPASKLIKIHGSAFQEAGIPDLIGCVEGRFIGLEVKVPGRESTLTRLQALTIEEILQAGGIGAMVTSPEEALDTLKDNL